jgi:AraC-like DNA-binding protein
MARILVRVAEDEQGAQALAGIRAAVPGAELQMAADWGEVITEFYPVNPLALVVEARVIDAQGRALIQDLRRETPWVPVIVLGTLEDLPRESIVALAAEGVTTFVAPASPNGSAALREAIESEVGVPGRAAAALRRRWAPDVPPAPVMAAVAFALQRSTERLSVDGMAAALGLSRRTLRRSLKRAGAPSPRVLLQWGRVLWAVHDLEADPKVTGEVVAGELGLASDNSLRNALAGCLDVRVNGARLMGLEGAVKKFVDSIAGPRERA